jgi:hypothetical protein
MPTNKRALKKRRNKKSAKPELNIATTSPVLNDSGFHAVSAEVVSLMLESVLSTEAETALLSLFNVLYSEHGTWTLEAIKALFEKKITHPGEQQVVLGFALKQFYEAWWRPVMLDVYQQVIARLARTQLDLPALVVWDDQADFVSLDDHALAIPNAIKPIITRTLKKVFPKLWKRAFLRAEARHFGDIKSQLTTMKCQPVSAKLQVLLGYIVTNKRIAAGKQNKIAFKQKNDRWIFNYFDDNTLVNGAVQDPELIEALNKQSRQETEISTANNDKLLNDLVTRRTTEAQKLCSDLYSRLTDDQKLIPGVLETLPTAPQDILAFQAMLSVQDLDLPLNALIKTLSDYLKLNLWEKNNERQTVIQSCQVKYNQLDNKQKSALSINWKMQTQKSTGELSKALSIISRQTKDDFNSKGSLAPKSALIPLAALFERSLAFAVRGLMPDQEKRLATLNRRSHLSHKEQQDQVRLQDQKQQDLLSAERAKMIVPEYSAVPPMRIFLPASGKYYARLLPEQAAEKYNKAMTAFSPMHEQFKDYDECLRLMLDLTHQMTIEVVPAEITQRLRQQVVKVIGGRIHKTFDEITARPAKREDEVAVLTKAVLACVFACANTEQAKFRQLRFEGVICFEENNAEKFAPSYQAVVDIIQDIDALVNSESENNSAVDVLAKIKRLQQKIKRRGSGVVSSKNPLLSREYLKESHKVLKGDFEAFAALLETVIDLEKRQQLSARPSIQADVAWLTEATINYLRTDEGLAEIKKLKYRQASIVAAEDDLIAKRVPGANAYQKLSDIVTKIEGLLTGWETAETVATTISAISANIQKRKQEIATSAVLMSGKNKKTLQQSSPAFDSLCASIRCIAALNEKQANFEKQSLAHKIKNPIGQSIEYRNFLYIAQFFGWHEQARTQQPAINQVLAQKNAAGKPFSPKQQEKFQRIVKHRAGLRARYSKNPLPVINNTKKGKQIVGEQKSYDVLLRAASLKMQLKLCGGPEALSLIFALHKAFRDWYRGQKKGETAPGQLLVLNQCMMACGKHIDEQQAKKQNVADDQLSVVSSDDEVLIETPQSKADDLRKRHIADYVAGKGKKALEDLSGKKYNALLREIDQKITHAENLQAAHRSIIAALEPIETQANDLIMRGHYPAADKLWHCHQAIIGHANDYFLKDETLKNKATRYAGFSSKVTREIEKVQKDPVISRHRETKGILATVLLNVGLAIVGLGVIYVATGLLRRYRTGRFFVQPKTKTEALLGGLTMKTRQVASTLFSIKQASDMQRWSALSSANKEQQTNEIF